MPIETDSGGLSPDEQPGGWENPTALLSLSRLGGREGGGNRASLFRNSAGSFATWAAPRRLSSRK